MPSLVPIVVEHSHKGDRAYDIYSRLLIDRIIILGTQIDRDVANTIVAQMLFLDSENPDEQINLYINSPGGTVSDGMAIYDTMQLVRAPVSTICMGLAASMGAMLLTAGEPGLRKALPNSKIMIHQPLGGCTGQASDIEIQSKEMMKVKAKLNELLAKHTGQPLKTIKKDTDRDNYMTAEEAVAYGLVDSILEKK